MGICIEAVLNASLGEPRGLWRIAAKGAITGAIGGI